MKKLLLNILGIVAIVVVTSCASQKATAYRNANEENEAIILPDLKQFLKEHPSPRVVLRVPAVSTVTGSETNEVNDYNSLYGQIEKNLMKAGFVVRDRGLLNSLLSSGQTNYREVGEKIETDIIIDITTLEFDLKKVDNIVFSRRNEVMQRYMDYYRGKLYAEEVLFECKIIIVEKGQAGAIITRRLDRCTEGCNFELWGHSLSPENTLFHFPGEQDKKYNRLNWTFSRRDAIDSLSKHLVNILKNMEE